MTSNGDRVQKARRDYGPVLAYAAIVVLAVLFFWDDGRDDAALCNSATENRAALISVVQAIDTLGRSLILDGKPEAKASFEQRAALHRVDEFRQNQLDLLSKPIC